jgi:hypothetical protein
VRTDLLAQLGGDSFEQKRKGIHMEKSKERAEQRIKDELEEVEMELEEGEETVKFKIVSPLAGKVGEFKA